MPTKTIVSGLALSLVPAWSARQYHLSTEGAPSVVQTISALLQQREMGSLQLHDQLAQYAAVTPGAADQYKTSLQLVVDKIENELEKQVKDAQTATQAQVDQLFKAFGDANTAANAAKTKADSDDKAWFECAADELSKKQAAEAADKSLSTSRSNENEACQLQQDDRPFAFDAAGKYATSFKCDFGTGNCDAAFEEFKKTVLDQIKSDATASLAKEQANYNSLKATCDSRKQEAVAAQSAKDSADGEWNTKRAQCSKMARMRESSLCAYGSSVQAKCVAESAFDKFVESTKTAGVQDHSEKDREAEWNTLQTTKCLLEKSIGQGLAAGVAAADVDACTGVDKFGAADTVAFLNTKQTEAGELAGSNKCVAAAIEFFNGQTWKIKAEEPASSDYTREAFAPQLDPAAGNFGFCSV